MPKTSLSRLALSKLKKANTAKMSKFSLTRNTFSPQRPMSGQYSDDEDVNGKALSIHSLEKRRIPLKKDDDETTSQDSVMIDNTLSPSPPKRNLDPESKNAFLKRLGSTNIDSGDVPIEYKNSSAQKGLSKLARMDSYEASKGVKQGYVKNLSPDLIRPEKMIGHDSPTFKLKASSKTATKPNMKNLPK